MAKGPRHATVPYPRDVRQQLPTIQEEHPEVEDEIYPEVEEEQQHEQEEAADEAELPSAYFDVEDPTGDTDMDEETRASISDIPPEVKLQVRRCHRNLGHCSQNALLRIMRLGGASEQHMRYGRAWRCPTCERRQAPGKRRVASSWPRPKRFGELVGLDVKELKDIDEKSYLALNVLDMATKFSTLVLLPDGASRSVTAAFMQNWVHWAGVPGKVVVDAGTEFKKDFTEAMNNVGVSMRVVPTETPWQHGATERHGAVLGDIVGTVVQECNVSGREAMAMTCAAASLAKNRRPDRSGFSPRVRVFGMAETLPGSVLDSWLGEADGAPNNVAVHDAALSSDQVQDSFRIRAAALAALEKLDANDKWRRAIVADFRPTPDPFHPGECVFYWRSKKTFGNMKSRGTRRFERWWGPAVVIGQERGPDGETDEAYWIVHNGNLMVVAPQHLRRATAEERLASEVLAQVMEDYGNMSNEVERGQHTFEDLRHQEQGLPVVTSASDAPRGSEEPAPERPVPGTPAASRAPTDEVDSPEPEELPELGEEEVVPEHNEEEVVQEHDQ